MDHSTGGRPPRILLVGSGFAGSRFRQVFQYIQQTEENAPILAGVCDIDGARLNSLPKGIAGYTDFEGALQAVNPDILAITVNEYAHYGILGKIGEIRQRLVLCEKPLTQYLSQAMSLKPVFGTNLLCLNHVERFSAINQIYFDWIARRPELSLVKVEFFWGKNRIFDDRPSMGVLSELTHPIDLVDYFFGFDDYSVENVMGVYSDFSPRALNLLEALDVYIKTPSYSILGHTSFAWAHRRRQIVATFSDRGGKLYMVSLDYDVPFWDCDSIHIYRMNRHTMKKETVLEAKLSNTDFPRELTCIYKVYQYIKSSFRYYASREEDANIVGYGQALKIQQLLENIRSQLETQSQALYIDGYNTPVQTTTP